MAFAGNKSVFVVNISLLEKKKKRFKVRDGVLRQISPVRITLTAVIFTDQKLLIVKKNTFKCFKVSQKIC